MMFGVVGQLGPRMKQLDGDRDRPSKGAIFGVNVGRPIVTNGAYLHCCVKVCESIKLLFAVVSGVSPGIGVLHGVHTPRKRGGFGKFSRPLV